MVQQAPAKLRTLLEPVVTGMGYELLGVEYLSQGHRALLRLYIDNPKGITLDDCERVSHQVNGVLEVEDPIAGQYTLEVSSPGLDRPLFIAEHFQRFIGSVVRIKLITPMEGRHKLVGTLTGVEGDQVMMVENGIAHSVPLAGIAKANLVPNFTH